MAAYIDSSILSMSINDLEYYEILNQRKVVVVIPAFNEERFIGSVVLKVKQFVDTVIVVDDGSTDTTSEVAAMAGALVVRQHDNRGKGIALNTGFQRALDFNPDVVVTIDADGQHKPEDLPGMILPILKGDADLVVGSRYLEETSDVPLHRILGHKFFNFFTKTTSGTQVSDSQSGYRAFSRRALDSINFSSAGFSVESEMQFIANEHELDVKEVPITITYKDKPKRSVWGHGLSVLGGILRLAGQYRPLAYIGLPSAVVVLLGFIWGLYVVDIYRRTATLAVGYAMISVLLSLVGMVGFSTGVILHSVRGLLQTMLNSHKK